MDFSHAENVNYERLRWIFSHLSTDELFDRLDDGLLFRLG